ncbi:MAG: hypothetical protein WBQ43_05160 [Terriglobales bacterium]
MDWQPFLTSAVVAALVGGFVSRRNIDRTIQIENITRERAKWRDKIRTMATEARLAVAAKDAPKLQGLQLDFSLNLNPLDKEDQEILNVIDGLSKPDHSDQNIQELFDRLALLLKHDWDRAKCEAKPWSFLRSAHRHTYAQFKEEKH